MSILQSIVKFLRPMTYQQQMAECLADFVTQPEVATVINGCNAKERTFPFGGNVHIRISLAPDTDEAGKHVISMVIKSDSKDGFSEFTKEYPVN